MNEYTEFVYWGGSRVGIDRWKCLDCGEVLLSGLALHADAHGTAEVRIRGSRANVGTV